MENRSKFETKYLKTEIQSVMQFKNHDYSEGEAEAIIGSRLCSVEISFDVVQQLWALSIYQNNQLIFKKRSTLSNRQGVVSGIWSFIDPSQKVPWSQILRGKLWRSEDVLLEHLFWLRLENENVGTIRDLLVLKTSNHTLH